MTYSVEWTKKQIKKDAEGNEYWIVTLFPNFMDMSKTEFPDGIPFHFEDEHDPEEYVNANNLVTYFMNSTIGEYLETLLEDPEYFADSKFEPDIENIDFDNYGGSWTNVGNDVDYESMTLKAHIRLAPDFVELESIGLSWGLSILRKNYYNKDQAEAHLDINKAANKSETYSDRMKVERFMNSMLVSYNKINK